MTIVAHKCPGHQDLDANITKLGSLEPRAKQNCCTQFSGGRAGGRSTLLQGASGWGLGKVPCQFTLGEIPGPWHRLPPALAPSLPSITPNSLTSGRPYPPSSRHPSVVRTGHHLASDRLASPMRTNWDNPIECRDIVRGGVRPTNTTTHRHLSHSIDTRLSGKKFREETQYIHVRTRSRRQASHHQQTAK